MVLGTDLRYIGFTRTRENVRKEGGNEHDHHSYYCRINFLV